MEKDLIKTLLFYAEMLQDKKKVDEFREDYEKMSITWDYYHRALDKAREILNKDK
jgi:hypothetical protein